MKANNKNIDIPKCVDDASQHLPSIIKNNNNLTDEQLRGVTTMLKALADSNRLQLLLFLQQCEQPICVTEIVNATEDKNELIDLANSVSDLEYQMQYVWGFNLDSKVHDWFNVPKCTCPKSDNKERKGTKYKIHNQKCLIHGS